jgi:broad specificity phosphatase PhoE
MAHIYFLRHGESLSNVKDTFSGLKDDASLTPKGEAQARVAGEGLKSSGIRIDRIIASSLIRAQKTAHLVSGAIGFDASRIETDSRFGEYDMGELTGKPRVSVTSAQLIAAAGAEDPHLFMQRVGRALTDLENYGGNVLVVSHAGVGRIIRCHKEGLDPTGFYDLPAYPNATVVPL